jgi:uncharacterized membrane protein YphA (DoxX/SURF4 family)
MFKQILSTKLNATLTSIALLVLRVGLSAVMIPHGYQKLVHFGEYKAKFMDFLGLGAELSLVLAIGAELICSILLGLGFLTRFTVVPLVVTMVTEAVTTIEFECLPAAMAEAISIQCNILPPRKLCSAFVSFGRTISVIMIRDSDGVFVIMISISQIYLCL